MNKVITINLNGRAYQLEESGYEAIKKYLQEAEEKLGADTGKEEIIKDLEQAIAEKFDHYLSAHKSVITSTEVSNVIAQMGPVQNAAEQSEVPGKEKSSQTHPSGKRLFKIRQGSMISGVCMGLAAYFNVDVTLIRIIFVILVLVTHGLGVLIYLVMIVVVPEAESPQQTAAAFGQPYTAQDFVNRAREEYSKFADKGEWKKWKYEFKKKMQEEKWQRKQQRYQNRASRPASPLLGLFGGLLSLLWILGLLMIVTHHAIFGLTVPSGLPLWVTILLWLCLYNFVMWPIKAARWTPNDSSDHTHWHSETYHDGFIETVVWFAFFGVVIWLLWQYVPGSHPVFEKISLWGQHVWAKISGR